MDHPDPSPRPPTEGPLWVPAPDRVKRSHLASFAAEASRATGRDLSSYPDLHRWSISNPGDFWDLVWRHSGVIGERGTGPAWVPGADFTSSRWFPGALVNYAENCLERGGPADTAVVEVDETGARRSWSRADLRSEVAAVAAALRAEGVVAGDRVAAWVPNSAAALVAMLATSSLGAVFSSTSPDFGIAGVEDRFGQIEPVVLFATEGYSYNGRALDCADKALEIARRLPTLRRVVLIPAGPLAPPGSTSKAPSTATPTGPTASWEEWVGPHRGAAASYERRGFDHPLYVLFSSGTTGKPKCIVHSGAGVLMTHLREHRLHCDVHPGDRVFWFTTCGWMMWNWLASALASGATAVLYDGSPFHPGPERLWDLASTEGVTHLGVSAKYLDSVASSGFTPTEHPPGGSPPTMRMLASTGSPLSAERFEWVYREVSTDVHLASISGGTDLCGCFVAGDPTSPVWAGEIQRPALGMDVDVVDDTGRPLPEGAGELVCRTPFPSVPLRFWADPDGRRFRAAYFERFPGWWHHGDFARRTAHGGFVILGRSDATLNPGGVRIGTAEIYRVVEQLPEVVECLAFGQGWEGDVRVVLLVRLTEGSILDDALTSRIRRSIREGCSPRHVPALILAVDDLPRTRSNKLVELAVADVVAGRPVRNTDAIANPEALWAIRDHPLLVPGDGPRTEAE